MLRTKGGIYVSPSVESGVEMRVAFTCLICGAQFRDEQASLYSSHVAKCAHDNEADLREMSPRVRAPGLFGDKVGDPEYEAWVRKHGRVR